MQLLADMPLLMRLERWSRYLAVAVIMIASLVLVGWQFDIDELRRLFPFNSAMNPLTAITFIFSGISFLLITSSERTKNKSIAAYCLATIVLLIGVIQLSGLFIEPDWHIDQLLFGNKVRREIFNNVPNSMAPNTAFCFIITGITLWLIHIETNGKWIPYQYLALIVASIGWLSILGYLYRAEPFYGMYNYSPMSLYSAVSFFCVSLAMLFAHPAKGLMKQFTSAFSGSFTARLLIPIAILAPTVLGLLRLYGYWEGVYPTEFGVALYTLSFIIIFLVVVWYNTYTLNKRDVVKKYTEDALRNSEEEIAAIFRAAPDAVIVIDGKSRITRWNPEAEVLFGWKASEVIGRELTDTIIPPHYREAHKKGMTRYMSTGQSRILGQTVEVKAIKKDKTEIDISLRISPVMVKDAHLFVGFVRDITDQKRMAEKLKNFNESLALQVENKTKEITEIFERLTDGFIALDRNFCFTYVNKKAGELIHRDPVSIIGKNVWEEFPDAVGSETDKAFHRAMEEQVPVVNTDYYRPFNLWQENHIYPTPDGISVFIRDITNKKVAEKQLRLSEQKYKLLFFSNPLPMFMLNLPDYSIFEVNASALIQYGYTREEFLDLTVYDLRPEEDIEKFKASTSVTFRNIQRAGIWRHKKKDGTIIYVDVTTHDTYYEDRPVRLVLASDVTERYIAEEKLKESYDSIRKLTEHLQNIREEERTHIAREIHDELGQQLTVLKMDIAWLKKKLDKPTELVKQKMADLLSMIDTTVKTVRRISSELRPSLLDDLGLVPAMEWHLEEFEKRSGIQKEFSIPQNDLQLSDDIKIGLFRIFQESLTNVARHAKAKKVNIRLEKNDKKVILTIKDDGLGFDEKDASKKTLGILGMKERTLMLGGEYTISGVPGKGTTVSVAVPLNGSNQNKN